MKSQVFQGLLFAIFRTSVDRDTVVALLRRAEMHEKGKRVGHAGFADDAARAESFHHGTSMAAWGVGLHEEGHGVGRQVYQPQGRAQCSSHRAHFQPKVGV